MKTWTSGDVDLGQTLTDNDHLYPAHINELRTAINNTDVYDITDYGAVGDDVVDCTTLIQAAIDDMPSTGGTLFIPRGVFKINGTLTVTKPITVFGVNYYKSCIRQYSETAHTFTVTCAEPVIFKELWIRNGSGVVKSAGSGIYLRGAAGTGENPDSFFERVRVSGHYYGFYFSQAAGWHANKCLFVSNLNIDFYIANSVTPDSGDSYMTGCLFNGTNDYAIYQASSGGLRMIGNKILHHKVGYELDIADGAETGILIIEGNSFDGQTVRGIDLVRNGTTGTFTNITIIGNSFRMTTADGYAIDVNNDIYNVMTINSNTIYAANIAYGIRVNHGQIGIIQGNNLFDCVVGLTISVHAIDIDYGPNFYNSCATDVVNNSITSGPYTTSMPG